jgi:hypothetical protein
MLEGWRDKCKSSIIRITNAITVEASAALLALRPACFDDRSIVGYRAVPLAAHAGNVEGEFLVLKPEIGAEKPDSALIHTIQRPSIAPFAPTLRCSLR